MVAEMLTVGPQAMKGSYIPLVKKMFDDCLIADSPKLHAKDVYHDCSAHALCFTMQQLHANERKVLFLHTKYVHAPGSSSIHMQGCDTYVNMFLPPYIYVLMQTVCFEF